MATLILLKSLPNKFAHQAGYYLLNGRWHAMKGKPAPKGAPVAAHPHAAGQHAPVKHFSDDEWNQLKLPDSNVNAGTYNKQLDQLKQHSEAGHVTGIVGAGYGVNTYGKKLATIANHLLKLHGSEHQVTPGQKAGEHQAVQSAPADAESNGPVKQADLKEAAKVEPKPADPPSVEPVTAPSKGEASTLPAMPQFEEGKEAKGVVAYYEKQANKVLELAAHGHVDVLHSMLANGMVPNKKGKVSNTFAGKTKNSKLFLQFLLDAQKHAEKVAGHGPNQTPQPEPEPEQKPAAAPEPVAEQKPAEQKPAATGSKVSQIPWDSQLIHESNSNAKTHNNKVMHIKKLAESGDLAGLEAFKAGKNTYGKKQMKLAQLAIAALKEDGQAPAPADEPFPDTTKLAEAFKQAKAKEQSKDKPKKPIYSPGDAIDYYCGKIEDAMESGNIAEVEQYIKKFDGHTTAGYQKIADYGKAVLAYMKGNEEPKSPEKPVMPDFNEDELSKIAGNLQTKFQNYLTGGQKFSVQHALNIINNNKDAIEKMGSEHGKLFEYAGKIKAYIDADGPQDGVADGPKEGDTKPGADGVTLVFHNGRWHKQKEAEPAAEPKAAEAAHPIDAVPMPDLSSFNPNSQKLVEEGIKNLKQAIKDNGPSALNGIAKKIKGYTHITLTKDNGYKFKVKGHELVTDSSATKLYDYVMQLKEAAGKPKKASKAKKAAVAAKAPATTGIESMDSWQQTGPQGGSNPGGKFKDESGVEWYCKFPSDEDTAKAEVLAAKLYGLAGVTGQDAKLITKNGKLGIASKWVDVKKASANELANTDGVASGFAVDAWLANWDVVGLGYDNLQVGADGKAVRVDAGGSLMYRAQGGKKAFGDTVPELDSLRDASINPQSAKVFAHLTDADITASVAKVVNIPDSKIVAMVMASGFGTFQERQELAQTLIKRKKYLAEKFPKAVKKKEVKFDPSKISLPPDFLNWGNTGQSGPSSKPFLNSANNAAVQDILQAAKSGDIQAIQNLKAPIFNKDSGDITGYANVLEHPSQHVKGYAQQVVNEITYQMNPPEKFRLDADHPLFSLNAAYPPATSWGNGDSVAKIGYYINLGEPGPIDPSLINLPKITYKSGKLTQQTYSAKAKALIAKMPTTQRQAVKAYTGSSYKQMNQSLWDGNPTGMAKSAAEALHTLSHDIEPGTVLSRKVSISGSVLNQLLESSGKVIQEPAIMSTSIRPSCWGGNVHFKMTAGPGVKGLWVGVGSLEGGGALSSHSGEDEIVLPPNTRMMVTKVTKNASMDADGFGGGGMHVIEVIILPSEGY